MKHPEGRLVAIQQQLFFATLLAEQVNMPVEVVLRKLAMAGLRLITDEQEIAADTSAIYPSISNMRKQHLSPVPNTEGK